MSNKDNHRQSRAERRAANEAAAKAAAERAAKERRQQTIIGACVLAVIVVLIAVIALSIWQPWKNSKSSEGSNASNLTVQQAYDQLQKVKNKPTTADAKGGILLSKNGVGKKANGAPTVAIYMDFMCSGCGNFNRLVDPTLEKMLDAGQLNIELHPMSFGDRWSSDNYSTRAANMLLYITEHDNDPAHILGFISNMYADDFQPAENSGVATSDAQMKKQATKAGVSQKVADAAVTDKYTAWLDAIDTYTPKRSDLWNTSGDLKGQMTTPTITINGKFWDMNQSQSVYSDTKSGLLAALGIDESKVGVAGTMPSIGENGKPIAVSANK